MTTQISNFNCLLQPIDSLASRRGRFWPFSLRMKVFPQQFFFGELPKWPLSIYLSTGGNQKIIEKRLICDTQNNLRPLWSTKFFCFFMPRRLESVFQDEKIFCEIFFQNIFHFSIKTRKQQKILWSILNSFDPKWCRFHIDKPECIVCSPYFVQNKGYGPLIL